MADIDCSSLHHIPNLTDKCGFVRNTSSCDNDDGFVNYIQLLYCVLSNIPLWLACVLLFIWWLFLFCGLAVTADDFFCPSLAVISRSLKLSDNVAIFLAFGNGAPDIFSAVASIGNAKDGDAGLAIGALFGAGIFVTAVVAGSIAIIKPFQSMERPFLRDVIFYLGATFWAGLVMWDKKITQLEAAGFIILYVIYVVVVIIGRLINQKLKTCNNKSINALAEEDYDHAKPETETLNPLPNVPPRAISNSITNSVQIEETTLLLHRRPNKNYHMIHDFLQDINPISPDEWREQRCYGKCYQVFKFPLVLLLRLTVPIVGLKNEDDDLQNWNRLLNSVHVFTGPVFGIFITGVGFKKIGGEFPAYALVIIVCAILAAVIFFTSKTNKRPVYHTASLYQNIQTFPSPVLYGDGLPVPT